jgi:hypothetical protein
MFVGKSIGNEMKYDIYKVVAVALHKSVVSLNNYR